MIPAHFICWARCGTTLDVELATEPRFGYELAAAAERVGWVGVMDGANQRTLIFCSRTCLESQRIKDGSIRKRAKPASSPTDGGGR